MSELKQPTRYNYVESDGVQGIGWISEDVRGVFVTYQDYLALETEFHALQKKFLKKRLAWKKSVMHND